MRRSDIGRARGGTDRQHEQRRTTCQSSRRSRGTRSRLSVAARSTRPAGAPPRARATGGQRTGIINQIRAFLLERGIAVRLAQRFLRAELPRGALTAPTSVALTRRWRSRPQHHQQTRELN